MLAGLGDGTKEEPRPDPAVSARASVKNDHIVCLEGGKKFRMLKRHLGNPSAARAPERLPLIYRSSIP